MKKVIFILILNISLIITFCSKKSTDSNTEEDNITVEILVTENGSPVQNLFIIVAAKVQESVRHRDSEIRSVVSYAVTQEDQVTTNSYGKAVFNYTDKSLPEEGGIYIENVTIKRLNDVIFEDTEEKFVKKGEKKTFEYNL